MTTYNTGNPVGSAAVKDLYDNTENLDVLVNDRTKVSHPDRLGVDRKTWWGMEQDFQQFLINSGYENIGDYAAGLEITARNQIFWRDGELYRAGAVLELPYTTTGDWGDEEGLFVAVGDAILRQELNSSSPGYGSSMVKFIERTVDEKLRDIVSIKDYLPLYSTETEAVQAAVNAAEDKILIIDEPITITSTINFPKNITIDGSGKIFIQGDEDFWFFSNSPDRIYIKRMDIEFLTPFSERTLLNRAIRVEGANSFEIDVINVNGASTAVHCLGGDFFRCDLANLRNIRGIDAQYGYGVNTSARVSILGHIRGENDLEGDGRHLIYINGSTWEDVSIRSYYCKNFRRNPIQIINTSAEAVGVVDVGDGCFINCNTAPTNSSNGCLHFPAGQSGGIKARVGEIYSEGSAGGVFSNLSDIGLVNVSSILIKGQMEAALSDTYLVYIRGSDSTFIDDVFLDSLPSSYNSAIRFRDSGGGAVKNITVRGPTGTSVVNLIDVSNIYIGPIDAEINHIVSTRSDFNKNINYFDGWREFTSSDPDVSEHKYIYTTVSVLVTNFINGQDGQQITVLAQTGATVTIQHGPNIFTRSGSNLVVGQRQTASFVLRGSSWFQI